MKAAPRQRRKSLTLPAILDMGSTQGLKDSLIAALDQSLVLRLNGSKTQLVSTPAVQVLLAASLAAEAGGGKTILLNPSPSLRSAFQDLGLASRLNEWGAADA